MNLVCAFREAQSRAESRCRSFSRLESAAGHSLAAGVWSDYKGALGFFNAISEMGSER